MMDQPYKISTGNNSPVEPGSEVYIKQIFSQSRSLHLIHYLLSDLLASPSISMIEVGEDGEIVREEEYEHPTDFQLLGIRNLDYLFN